MKTIKDFINEGTTVTIIKPTKSTSMNSKWFDVDAAAERNIKRELTKLFKKTRDEQLDSLLSRTEKYSFTIALQIGNLKYGLYNSYGEFTIAAGGNFFSKANAISVDELNKILASAKFIDQR